MLKVWGRLGDYEGDPGFLHGDQLLISEDGKVYTFCAEKNVLCRYAVAEPGIIDSIPTERVYEDIWTGAQTRKSSQVLNRSLAVSMQEEIKFIAIYTRVTSPEYRWTFGGVDHGVMHGFEQKRFFTLHEASDELLDKAMDDIKEPLQFFAPPSIMQQKLFDLSLKFDLFLLAWMNRELKSREVQHA